MKVFLCEPIHPAAYRLLEQNAEIIADRARMHEADALISRMISVGQPEMDLMPDLKVIAVHGTGTDGIDLKEAKKRGIQVVYAPHMNANSVAELNVALLLSVMRKTVYARRLIDRRADAADAASIQGTDAADTASARRQAADAASIQRELRGHELKGKTAGFIGFGAIGGRTAEILHCGFGMDCIAWSPSLTPERAGQHFSRCAVSAEEVIRTADAVFLALPLTDSTRSLMDRDKLYQMKQGAVLINTSRAGLVDEEALREVLESGHLGGAATDVLAQEIPDPDHPLLKFPGFVVTPHIGANTDEALYEVGMCCVRQILDVMSGKEPEYPVP
jgi:D-3-phosphoglycerate dehydrogenase